jgi:ABC-type Fe3+-siderophore transport system permease subunit
MLDLRWPMGLMFSLVGAILIVYGLITWGGEQYSRSLGINVNVWWGLALLAFGLVVLGLACWAAAVEKTREQK